MKSVSLSVLRLRVLSITQIQTHATLAQPTATNVIMDNFVNSAKQDSPKSLLKTLMEKSMEVFVKFAAQGAVYASGMKLTLKNAFSAIKTTKRAEQEYVRKILCAKLGNTGMLSILSA